jgi:glycosyltransferase involved in cell wall biosynthesis
VPSSYDSRTIKVCFVVGTMARGGAERQLAHMLGSFRDHRVDARVMCLTKGEALQREIEECGISVEWVGADPSHAARLETIVSSLRHEPADIVQSAHFYTNLYAAVAATFTGARSIGAVRNDVISELRSNLPFGLADLLLPHYLVVNSALACQRAVKLGRSPKRVLLVRNAVDASRFQSSERPGAGPPSESLRLLFVGRLIPQKRADRFLRLVSAVARVLPGRRVEARIVGDGPYRAALENVRDELHLDPDQVQFVGAMDDVAPLYAWADVLVLTSDYEGTPNVVLEAMASELPVVATAVGGVPDLLCRGGGLMVRPESEDELCNAVARLATDARFAKRLTAEGNRYVAHNHSLDSLWRQLDLTYRTVTGRALSGQTSP